VRMPHQIDIQSRHNDSGLGRVGEHPEESLVVGDRTGEGALQGWTTDPEEATHFFDKVALSLDGCLDLRSSTGLLRDSIGRKEVFKCLLLPSRTLASV
jgi:hypothetical protein